MPLRDSETTLAEAINSLRQQTWSHLEIVLVDHNSADSSPAIIKRAASEDARIRSFRHEGTFVEAANLAWQFARGDFIARMDSDDVAHPERIEKQIQFMISNPGLSACGTLVNIVKRGENRQPVRPDGGYERYEAWVNSVVTYEEILIQRFVDSPIPNPTAMIKRTILNSLGGYQDPLWAEDYDFWLRLLESGHRIAKVDMKLLDWYDSDSRATRNLSRYDLSRFQAAKAHFLERLPMVAQLGVVICGAGPVGKEMARLLRATGVNVQAFFEVNERQIGNRISGIPVLGSGDLPNFTSRAVVLGAVGQEGAREQIRSLITDCNFTEGKDFFCVA